MKKSLTVLFVTLGVVFVILLLVGAGFYAGMFGFGGSYTPKTTKTPVTTSSNTTNGNSSTTVPNTQAQNIPITLSDAQKAALRGLGIDPNTIPSSITPTQATCFEEKLGTARFTEIRAGSSPSPMDFLKAKSCI